MSLLIRESTLTALSARKRAAAEHVTERLRLNIDAAPRYRRTSDNTNWRAFDDSRFVLDDAAHIGKLLGVAGEPPTAQGDQKAADREWVRGQGMKTAAQVAVAANENAWQKVVDAQPGPPDRIVWVPGAPESYGFAPIAAGVV